MLAVLCIGMFYNGLTLRSYEIKSDKITNNSSVRIVVISDLHSNFYGENQQDLIKMIEEQDPDIVALVGDIVDDNRSEAGAIEFLEGIQNLAPTYYVIGNHEVWSGEWDRIKEMAADFGITILTNESEYVTINGVNLCISGIDDPEILKYSDDEEIRAMMSGDELLDGFFNIDDRTYNILLAHRPERFASYQTYSFDLVLCGHAHGGQVRIPGIMNGLIAPDQDWFPKYAGGKYVENGQTMIVSRGLEFDERVPRIFNPPEVVVVDIMGNN